MIDHIAYLFLRLKQLGVKHVFGTSVARARPLVRMLLDDPDLTWIECYTAQAAASAAAAYAQVQGIGVIIFDHPYQELAASNILTNAYQQQLWLISIHNYAHSVAEVDLRCYVARNTNSSETFTQAINRILHIGYLAQQPVQINLADNITQNLAPDLATPDQTESSTALTSSLAPLQLRHPTLPSDANAQQALTQILTKHASKAMPILVIASGRQCRLTPIAPQIQQLQKHGWWLSTRHTKGLLDETSPSYAGVIDYPHLSSQLCEQAGLIIEILPNLQSNNLFCSSWQHKLLQLHWSFAQFQQLQLTNLAITDALAILESHLNSIQSMPLFTQPLVDYPWLILARFLASHDLVVANQAQLEACLELRLPNGCQLIEPTTCIEPALGIAASLGVKLAKPQARCWVILNGTELLSSVAELQQIVQLGLQTNFLIFNFPTSISCWQLQASYLLHLPSMLGTGILSYHAVNSEQLQLILREVISLQHSSSLIAINCLPETATSPWQNH